MRGIGVGEPGVERVGAGDGAEVLVLALGRGPGRLIGPGLRGVEQPVAVGVAALEGRVDAGLVVGHGDVRDRHVAGIGDHVGPGHRVADRDQRPGRVVGVGAVGRLLDVDLGADAEVVGGIGGAEPEALRVGAGGGAGVLVLARGRRPGRLEGPGLDGVKEAVGVVVAADEGRADAGLVVVDRDVCDRHVAGVGDHVGPGDRVADRDPGPGADVGVDPVGGLLDVELGAGAEVVGGVGVGDLGPRGAGAGRGAEVLVLAGLRLSARAAEDRLAGGDRQEPRTGQRHALIVGGRPAQRHVAGVGDLIGPGDRVADGDLGPGRGVGVLAVGRLLDVDRGVLAEVVGGIGVAHRPAAGARPSRGGQVLVLAGLGGAGGGGAGHRGVGREGRRGAGDRYALVVGDGHVRERIVAGVGDHIAPDDRIADRDQRPGRVVGVGAVGRLLDVDPGQHAPVVGGVAIGDLGPERVGRRSPCRGWRIGRARRRRSRCRSSSAPGRGCRPGRRPRRRRGRR